MTVGEAWEPRYLLSAPVSGFSFASLVSCLERMICYLPALHVSHKQSQGSHLGI